MSNPIFSHQSQQNKKPQHMSNPIFSYQSMYSSHYLNKDVITHASKVKHMLLQK